VKNRNYILETVKRSVVARAQEGEKGVQAVPRRFLGQ
jgi:hypothetical protein